MLLFEGEGFLLGKERHVPPVMVAPNLLSWAKELDEKTLEQAKKLARLWVLDGPVCLMPDAHLGKGATIGSVIATQGVIIPAAVGVDIGCGMIAVETSLRAAELPDDLDVLVTKIEQAIPAGLGKWHREPTSAALEWVVENVPAWSEAFVDKHKAASQLGTLGSGNHFFEVCLDERDHVWVVLHSGSRGVGNELAQRHIKIAQRLATDMKVPLEDIDLAYFVSTQVEFKAYVDDLLFAQEYAALNRDLMMNAGLSKLFEYVGFGDEFNRINCHHNYAALEHHHGRDVWVTRKGAIRARKDDMGVIPGSMGTHSFIVRGLGNQRSYNSCSHGAGRRLSRTAARKQITAQQLTDAMGDRAWLRDKAGVLTDEAPGAYKDVSAVMEAQADLVEPVHRLHQILNYKGV